WRRSGLSVRAFCAQQQVSEPSFYAWRRCLAEREQQLRQRPEPTSASDPATGSALFVPVSVVTAPAVNPFEVVLGHRRVVRVPAGFDAASLRLLLAILQEEPTC